MRYLPLILIAFALFAGNQAEAQPNCRDDGDGGSRCEDGSGWRSDGRGGFSGTGGNFGSGWQSDGRGGYSGSGDNFGSGWRDNGDGTFSGTGDNFGKRCRTFAGRMECD